MSQRPAVNSHETGWKPDIHDSRDFIFARLLVSNVPSVPRPAALQTGYETLLWKPQILQQPTLDLNDLSNNSPGVYDQGYSMQSCVANGIAMAACYAWHKKPGEDQDRISGIGDKLFDPSRWWIWYHARRLDGGFQNQNTGCSIRNAIKALHQLGCPPNSVWPYPQLTTGDYPDVPWDKLTDALKVNPDDNMYSVAKQNFINDFEYYSIKTIGLDWDGKWGDGEVEPPAEAPDRVIQIRMALAEGYPVVFAIGEFDIWDTQDPHGTKWNRNWAPVWEESNFSVGNIEGGTVGYDVIMNDLDPGFFPLDNPKLTIGNRNYGHVMIVIGSDARRELFLVQNSYGLYDNMAKNVQKKPYFWIPYNYFRTKIVDATWVIRTKQGGSSTQPPPQPQPNPPSGVEVTIQFSDDFSGANVNKQVRANAGPQLLANVLTASNVGSQGFLTSIQLKGPKPSTVAVVKKDGKVLGTAKGSGNDYAQFARTALTGVSIEVTV